MFKWLSVLTSGLSLLDKFAGWAQSRQLLDAGKAQALADSWKAQANSYLISQVAREAVRRELTLHPDSIMRDDGFQRPDSGDDAE